LSFNFLLGFAFSRCTLLVLILWFHCWEEDDFFDII